MGRGRAIYIGGMAVLEAILESITIPGEFPEGFASISTNTDTIPNFADDPDCLLYTSDAADEL